MFYFFVRWSHNDFSVVLHKLTNGGVCVCVFFCFKDLSSNRLEELPSSLGYLTCLQKLTLSHNKLTCLPESLGQLKSKTLCQVLWTDCGMSHTLTHKNPDTIYP